MTNQKSGNPPRIIYLQWIEDMKYPNDQVTWCENQINDDDVEYVLKSEFDKALVMIGEKKLKLMELEGEK